MSARISCRRITAALLGCALVALPALALAQDVAPAPVPAERPAPQQDLAQSLDTARKPPKDNATRWLASVELDHAFLRLYDQALQTTGARVGLGVQDANVTVAGVGDVGVGSLGTSGLHATSASLGMEALWRALSFLRLGGGARLGYLNVSRVTSSSPMEAFSVGAFLSAKVDLYDFGPRDDHGVFLGGRIDLDTYQGNGYQGPLIWGPEIMLGFRY